MNIKNDYSYLFDSLNNSGSNSGGSSNLFNAIDLTEYSTVVADLNLTSKNTFRFSIVKNATDTNYVGTATASKTGQQQLTIDVSAITGSYYIQFAAYLSKAEIQSVRLVR